MATREALEAALRSEWSPDELEVYADHLLGEGDPRGELIALDRRPAPGDPSWRQRRQAALVRWLGADAAASSGHLVQHGFIHELRCGSHVPELLDGELGTLIRGYAIWGAHPRVVAVLGRLAARPRPWLKRLAIAYWGTRPYPQELAAELIAATPNLEELHLIGRPVFRELRHPRVRRIVLDQAMPIEIPDVERERRVSVEHATGWPIASEDLELVQQIAGDLADWNLIVDWYAEAFDEPMPALLARLAAGGMIELDGPVVRLASALGSTPDVDIYADRRLFVDVKVAPETAIGGVRTHANQLASCMAYWPMPIALHQALRDYLGMLVNLTGYWPPDNPARRVLRSLVPALALAIDLLLERRALSDEPREAGWAGLETLSGLLSLPGAQRRVELRV